MKKMILSALVFLAFAHAAQAKEKVIKSCETSVMSFETGLMQDLRFQVLEGQNGKLSGRFEILKDGQIVEQGTTKAEIKSEKIRAGLKGDLSDIQGLNKGELLITHAMLLTQDPDMGGIFTVDMDLSKVRSAKIYVLGDQAEMGMTAIVEARDEKGQDMGSFLGGFLVGSCK